MSKQFTFSYQCPPIGLIPPQTNAGTVTSPYKSLRNCSGKVAIVCHINQANAAPVTLTVLCAENESGTGSVAIPAVAMVGVNDNTTTGDTLTQVGPNNTYTTDATIADKIVVFEFDPAEILTEGYSSGAPVLFNHIALEVSASNVANIVEAHMEYLGRYQQQQPPASEV